MNISRISRRTRTVVVNDRFGLAVYFCRIVLYWTNNDGQTRQRAFFCTSIVSERAAEFEACEYVASWLINRLKEKERKAAST